MAHFRSAFISDLHLGTRGSQAEAILDFLKDHHFERLYLVGDIIDIWAMRRGIYWPQEHNDVIQKLLRKARKGTEIIYIPGNHDEFVEGFVGQFGNLVIQDHAIHTTANDERILIIHGHQLDTVVQNMGWLAHLGDLGYKLMIEINHLNNWARHRLNLRPWSLSAYVKNEVKNIVGFIGKFEEGVARYARDYHVDSVLCGHIHHATIHHTQGLTYYNTGDWVESCTAIVEHYDGRMELLRDLNPRLRGAAAAFLPAANGTRQPALAGV
jgi:UDP-2,3-diacylglucosamine pyrophosphatase LpxH